MREVDGLAMSSRNLRLNAQERQNALAISQALHFVKNRAGTRTIEQVKKEACAIIKQAGLTIEYLEIVDPDTLENCLQWQKRN